jgi:hypothetical protein
MANPVFIPITIKTETYTIPAFDYGVLEVFDGTEKSSSVHGTIREIKVPPAGLNVRFLSGGGKEMAPNLRITTTFEYPKPPIAEPVLAAARVELAERDAKSREAKLTPK